MDKPRTQVSAAFAEIQSPELVASTNAWMAEFFGYESGVEDDDLPYGLYRDTAGHLSYECRSCERISDWDGTVAEYEDDEIKLCGGTQWCIP